MEGLDFYETVTLSCEYVYIATVGSLQWYRQYPGSRPEYLLLKYPGSTDVTRADPTFLRLDATDENTDNKKFWNLSISSAAVSDSALYYCAMTPTVRGNPATLCYHTQGSFIPPDVNFFCKDPPVEQCNPTPSRQTALGMTFLLCGNASPISFSPERSAAFLDVVDIWLLLYRVGS
uniref:Ig-like domain-containing protein n=1 Tax=Pygocentrus nattereri TaxID=42514 RepID=A0A3B4CHW8_PYGNA